MNLTINSQILAVELRLLNKIVPTKPVIEILSHALFIATGPQPLADWPDGSLALWTTDLQVGLSCRCQAQVHDPGTVALPVAKLLELVEQFPDGDITFASKEQHVTVKCGAFKARIQALSPADFPLQPEVRGQSSVINADAMLQLIARTRYAIDTRASKYVLNGALLTFIGQVAAMVATDSKRLALATANRTGPDARFIVPAKAIDVLVGHLGGDCTVTVGDRHLFFASNERLLTSQTLDVEFPKYERIIPRDNGLSLTVDRMSLMSALRRVNIVSNKNYAVYFNLQQGQLTLSSSSAEVGSADEVVQVAYSGVSLKICINGNYVLDFLKAAINDRVTMAFKDEITPVLLQDEESHIAVIMPMRG